MKSSVIKRLIVRLKEIQSLEEVAIVALLAGYRLYGLIRWLLHGWLNR
jgi:hypothetical protein